MSRRSSPRHAGRRARGGGCAAFGLFLCLALGISGGVAVTMSTEPDASAAVVAGAVEDSLGVEAADTLRDAYEAARSGTRSPPPAEVRTRAGPQTAPQSGAEAGDAADIAGAPAADPSDGVAPSAGPGADRSAAPSPSPSPSARSGPQPQEGSGLLGREIAVEPELSGKLVVAQGSHEAPADGTVWRVQVAVEKGLPVDPEAFADAVLATLNDPRGWNAADGSTFARTDSDRYDARVVLASPGTTDELCLPLDTIGELSCGIEGTAVLNFKRWARGSQAWESSARYRQYLVNHEVGHVIGYRHDLCAGPGEHATVMVQQTTTTSGCVPEPWPVPDRPG